MKFKWNTHPPHRNNFIPTKKEQQQAQEEAHKHFVVQEFSAIVLADGPASTLGQMSKEAHDEIRSTIIHEYTRRLVEANQGL